MPVTSYVCTQPNFGSLRDNDQCMGSNELRVCEITNGVYPTLLDGDSTVTYIWFGISPFVVLDIPQGWCVGSVKMDFFITNQRTPSINIIVHNMTQLSNYTFTVQAMHSGGTNASLVLNLPSLTCGRYLRIDMGHSARVILAEISVFGVGECSLCIVNCTTQPINTHTCRQYHNISYLHSSPILGLLALN